MRQGNMSNWKRFVMFLINSLSNAERIFNVSEEMATADKAASVCNLATPDIHFGLSRNTVSLDDASLDIASSESVWSGYVQTYAAFIYEGCCEEAFANSEAVYTDIRIDPGECYSRCKTDVIGMQTTTCHCNPRPEKARKYAKGCDTACSNPPATVCGGEKAVSIYRKVQYPGSDGRAETENCRAFFLNYNGYQSYTWRNCSSIYTYMCEIDVSPSITIECQRRSEAAWSTTTAMCLSYNKTPAVELSSGYPDSNCPKGKLIWIGQIRSRVIGKDADTNYQTPGWRRCVITKSGGVYLLQFDTDHPQLNSLCEHVSTTAHSDSTSAPSSDSTIQSTSLKSTTTTNIDDRNGIEQKSNIDNDQLSMIAVYAAAVPTVLVLFVVVVIVILCKRRKDVCGKEESRVEYLGTYPGTDSTIDTGALYQNTVVVMKEGSDEGHGTKPIQKGMPQGRDTDPGRDRTIDTDALYQNSDVINAESSAEGHGNIQVEKGMPQGRGTEPVSGSSVHGDALYKNTGV